MKRLLLSLLLFSGAQMLFGAEAQDAILAREIEKLEQNNNEVNKVRAVLEGRECPACVEPLTYFDDVPLVPETPVDLDAMTDEWNPHEGVLFLGGKGLATVQGFNDFSRAPEIKRLLIGGNPIRTLPAGAFEKYTNLKHLHIYHNQLTTIDNNAFQGLGGLESLDLSDLGLGSENSPLRITTQVLTPLHSLKELALQGNNLKTLPQWTGVLRGLTQLDLNDNQLELTTDTFSSFPKLEELNLSENRLTDLPEDIFKDKPLKILDLSENEFAALPLAVRSLSELQILDIDENKLELAEDTFKPFRELEELNLSDNDLEAIPVGMLDELFLLKDLRLAFNKLERLPVGALQELTRLTHLDLVGNNFSPEEQERIRVEVVSPDCQVFFTPEDKAIGLYGLIQNVDADLQEQILEAPGLSEVDAGAQMRYPLVPCG